MSTDLGAKRNGKRSLFPSVKEIMTDRQRDLPVWVRAPKRGYEFYSGWPSQALKRKHQKQNKELLKPAIRKSIGKKKR